jgi:hypothetical protein
LFTLASQNALASVVRPKSPKAAVAQNICRIGALHNRRQLKDGCCDSFRTLAKITWTRLNTFGELFVLVLIDGGMMWSGGKSG